jgi:hypothetical protein
MLQSNAPALSCSDTHSSVAEATGDPKAREAIWNYSGVMKNCIAKLKGCMNGIRQSPGNPENRRMLFDACRTIKDATASLVTQGNTR